MKMQATDPELETLVSRIKRQVLDLQPNFQRGEVWSVSKKKRLIDSILRGWHIPPIHIVVTSDGLHEVLDGQQRLAAIRDFMDGQFSIDGKIEPYDALIHSLHGCRYGKLPKDIALRFDTSTIRTFLLTDYEPEEPGELFFRLNQISSLTSAEQRNAFYGPARDQVKTLVSYLDEKFDVSQIGFNNKRMAYDDAKLLEFARIMMLQPKLVLLDEPFGGVHPELKRFMYERIRGNYPPPCQRRGSLNRWRHGTR